MSKEQEFKTQQECWAAVVSGKKLQYMNDFIVGFKDGVMWNFSGDVRGYFPFDSPEKWSTYIEPKPTRKIKVATFYEPEVRVFTINEERDWDTIMRKGYKKVIGSERVLEVEEVKE